MNICKMFQTQEIGCVVKIPERISRKKKKKYSEALPRAGSMGLGSAQLPRVPQSDGSHNCGLISVLEL